MLSTLLRPRNRRRRDKSPYSSPFNSSPLAARNDYQEINNNEENEDDYDEDEGDEDDDGTPLLPIFSSAHLGECGQEEQKDLSADCPP